MIISIPVGINRPMTAELWKIENNTPVLWASGNNRNGAVPTVRIEVEPANADPITIYFKFFRGSLLFFETAPEATRLSPQFNWPFVEQLKYAFNHPPTLPPYSVSGQIAIPDGTPLENVKVIAYHIDLEEEKELGHSLTDDTGSYFIEYQEEDLKDANSQSANLKIEVFGGRAFDELLITSPLILNAENNEVINLSVGEAAYRGKTEWRQLFEQLGGTTQTYSADQWTNQKTILLANRHQLPENQVANYVRAWQLSALIGGDVEAFYGLLQQGLPAEAAALASTLRSTLEDALKNAVAENLIQESYATDPDQLEDILNALEEKFPDLAINSELYDREKSELGRLLLASGLTHDEARQFLYDYKNNEEAMPEFWEKVKAQFGDRSAVIEQLQLRLQLAAVTDNQQKVIDLLIETYHLKDARELVRVSVEELTALLLQSFPLTIIGQPIIDGVTVEGGPLNVDLFELPESIQGDTLDEKYRNYATIMLQIVREGFATSALHYELKQDSEVESTYIDRFFEKNPEFDLQSTSLSEFLIKKPTALSGISNANRVKKEMQAFERVNRLLPQEGKVEGFKTLWNNQLTDSRSITQMGRAKFISLFPNDTQYQATARKTYNRAQRQQAVVAQILTSFGPAQHQTQIPAIPAENGIAEWKTLFGDGDYCACEHCRSVLSPSAYLVDLLTFVSQAIPVEASETTATNALQEFLNRRPDIGNILLNCENSHTEMPYLDLVMEVLENVISPDEYEDKTISLFGNDITVKVNKDKQTQGETGDLNTYPEHLKPAVYEQLIRENGQTLVHPWSMPFDIWQHEFNLLLEKLKVSRSAVVDLLTDNTTLRVRAYLNMSVAEYEAITHSGTAAIPLQNYWGIIGDSPDWSTELQNPKTFLKQSGLDFPTLETLTSLAFFKDATTGEGLSVQIVGCSLEDANSKILGLDSNDNLQKIPDFIRLQKKLGWSYTALDTLLRVIGYQEISRAVVHQISLIKRLSEQFSSIKLPELLSWLRPLDTYASDQKPSFYEQVFLNRLLLNSGGEIFLLNEKKTELANTTLTISDKKVLPILSSTVRLKEEEISALLKADVLNNSKLNFNNLSRLWQIGSFCKALRISASEYLDWSQLMGKEPISLSGIPANLFENIQFIQEKRSLGLDIEFLNWIIFDKKADNHPSIFGEEAIAFLENLREQLINADPRKAEEGGLNSEEETTEQKAAREELEESIAKALKEKRQQILVTEFSRQLELSPIAIERFLLKATLDGLSFFDLFLQTEMLTPKTEIDGVIQNSISDITTVVNAYQLIQKLKICTDQFVISEASLLFLFDHAAAYHLPDLTKVKAIPVQPDLAYINTQLNSWKLLVDLQKMSFAAADQAEPFLEWLASLAAMETINAEDFVEQLSTLMSWKIEHLEEVVSPALLGWQFPDALSNLTPLYQIFQVIELLQQSKASPDLLKKWASIAISPQIVHDTRNLLKSQYDETTWQQIMGPIRDQVRAAQRDALLTKLLHQPMYVGDTIPDFYPPYQFDKVGDIYRYFLIDPEMSACMKTSRTVQAIAAVQLFVQRILMGLEPQFYLDPEDAQEWEWRKNYRVWEANRKVFLYPENWIEPELRDDKSQFFKELETELLQGEVTSERVEDAYRNYLYKLDEVARPEVMALYEEEDETLHVIGRTRGKPQIYYYRKRMPNKYWTAWERMDLDIASEQIQAGIFNGRLYLFWLEFIEKGGNNTYEDDFDSAEVYLAWSEKLKEGWKPKRISDEALYFNGTNIKKPFNAIKDSLFIQLNIDKDHGISIPVFWMSGRKGEEESENYGKNYVSNISYEFFKLDYDGSVKLIKDSNNYYHGGTFEINSYPIFSQKLRSKYKLEIISKNGIESPYLLLNNPAKSQITISHQNAFIEGTAASDGRAVWFPSFDMTNNPFFYDSKKRIFIIEKKKSKKQSKLEPKSNEVNISKSNLQLNNPIRRGKYQAFENTKPVVSRFFANEIKTSNSSFSATVFDDKFADSIIDRRNGTTLLAAKSTSNGNGSTATSKPKDPGIHIIPKGLLGYKFEKFYHPWTFLLLENLAINNINGLLNPLNDSDQLSRQLRKVDFFKNQYSPDENNVYPNYPFDDFDFTYTGAYSLYNWELFFHIPIMMATRLSQNQKFEEAQKWFHYVFNPTETNGNIPEKYWKIKPFFNHKGIFKIENLFSSKSDNLEVQINAWEEDPFNPHLIARIRVFSYMRATVMKYLDNLISWGDYLFRRDTRESINEATQIYMLAADLLGNKPIKLHSQEVTAETFNELANRLDAFRNAVGTLTSELSGFDTQSNKKSNGLFPMFPIAYFCIPENDILTKYWGTVADRLFKIRNCMNVEGIERQLSLFQPPIDPALLVKARAHGLSIASVLDGLSAPPSFYRFSTMLQFANQLINDVKSLGSTLLGALEKKDGEALSLIRSDHEIRLLKEIRSLKHQTIIQIIEEIAGLDISKEQAEFTKNYFDKKEYMNREENASFELDEKARANLRTAESIDQITSFLAAVPQFYAGTSPSVSYGSDQISAIAQFVASQYRNRAAQSQYQSSVETKFASYNRRLEEWQYQAELAEKQITQIEKQITAAEIRHEIAETDLKNHDLQTEQAQAVQAYLKTKYTNEQLYSWMIGQLSAVYFQSYQLAFDMARKAEQQLEFELGINNPTGIIQYGYWDNLKKGLLAGDKLQYDLRRLEAAYYEQNKRDYEITKHISLRQLHPWELLKLRATGSCKIEVPEWLFDMDCPGHYNRRIKTIALSIPAIAGPYTGVNCTLSMTKNSVRISALSDGDYARTGMEDDRFKSYYSNVQSIVTSSGQNDSGLFEVNLRDERYLPFEGMGAISSWTLKLPETVRQFNYNTISDVILHVRYTAKEGGPLRTAAQEHFMNLAATISETTPLLQLFSLKHDFPQAWHQFKNTQSEQFTAPIRKDHFPYLVQAAKLEEFEIALYKVVPGQEPEEIPNSITQHDLDQLNEAGQGTIDINGAEIDLEAADFFLIVKYAITK